MSFEQSQNINLPVQESEKKKRRIVIADVDIEQQARDIAEERMLDSKEDLRGVGGFFKKIWKHNLAHEYYRQKEIAKARREIRASGNLYAGEKGEEADHADAMAAIVQRFGSEYEGEDLLRRGEEKRTLENEQQDDAELKGDIESLIKRFASGELSEEQFQAEKNELFEEKVGGKNAKESKSHGNAAIYADNLLEIAKQVKDNVAHGQSLDALDEDFEIVIGKARAGVESEAQYNAVDKITEKIQKSLVGKFVNETTVASAVAIAYGAIAKGATSVAHRGAKLVGPLGMGLSAGIGGVVAGVRESKRLKEERAQHAREMAKGKHIESGSQKREELEKFRYETRSAKELTGKLQESLEGLKVQPNEQQLAAVLEQLNEISSRITFSEQEKIDLVSFSDSKNVERERVNMYIAAAEARAYLKKNIHADWATFYNDNQQLEEYLQHSKEAKIQKEFKGEKTLKDEAFNKMRHKKVAWAVTKGLGVGLGVGAAAQEIGAYVGNGKEGLLSGAGSGQGEHHYTALGYLRRYISGGLPHKQNPLQGSSVGTRDFVKGHEDLFSRIKRGAWADNNTPRPDRNELKLWWGGQEGSGLDRQGNYVFNIKHMTQGGSFHDGRHWDPQELMKAGKMKLLISLSGDTQNRVMEIPIDAQGNAVIDPKSEIGKLAFANSGGHAKFLGRFAEVAVMGEKKNGVEQVSVLATHIGKGLKHVQLLGVQTAGFDVEAPAVIPVTGRKPLEKLKKAERPEEQKVEQTEKPQEAAVTQSEKTLNDWEMEFAQRESGDEANPEYFETTAPGSAQAANIQTASAQAQQNAFKREGADRYDTDPIRAAAWHTIRKLEDSQDLTYKDLFAPTAGEADEKFLELTRKLWDELTVHGVYEYVDGKPQLKNDSDLDGNSCLKLFELAGIKIGQVNYVDKGKSAEQGIVVDTSDNDGVVAEEDGKRLILDHHGENSMRDTSATKFVYEALVGLGLLKKEKHLDDYVDFVTKNDNHNFGEVERKQIFKNYGSNLYGLQDKLSVDEILELIKDGQDPTQPLPEDFLKTHTHLNKGKKNEQQSLFDYAQHVKRELTKARKEINEMATEGFVVDTGEKRFGRVLIDMKKVNGKGRLNFRLSREAGGSLAALASGYGVYLVWSPAENNFTIYTKRRMDQKTIKGGFSQGKNIRGNMWINDNREDPLKVTLEEILSKLAGKPFVVEGKLKEAIESTEKENKEQQDKLAQAQAEEALRTEKKAKIASSVKKMTELFANLELSHDAIQEEAKQSQMSASELAVNFIQKNKELRAQYKTELEAIPEAERDEKAKEKLALAIILGDERDRIKEKIKNEGENDALKRMLMEIEVDLLGSKLGATKTPDNFSENQFVKEVAEKSPELVQHLKAQMESQHVPLEAQLNFLEIVAKADFSEAMISKLRSAELIFSQVQQSNFPDKIGTIEKSSPGKMAIYLGRDEEASPDVDRLAMYLKTVLATL